MTFNTANDLIAHYEEQGFERREIADFLCDGEAMAREGIKNSAIVEDAYDMCILSPREVSR